MRRSGRIRMPTEYQRSTADPRETRLGRPGYLNGSVVTYFLRPGILGNVASLEWPGMLPPFWGVSLEDPSAWARRVTFCCWRPSSPQPCALSLPKRAFQPSQLILICRARPARAARLTCIDGRCRGSRQVPGPDGQGGSRVCRHARRHRQLW